MSNAILLSFLAIHQRHVTSAIIKIRVARSMREVKHESTIQTRPEIRHIPQTIIESRRLTVAAEQRMNFLLEEQLLQLSKHTKPAELKLAIAKYVNADWCHLRGNFANCFYRAQRESSRLIFKLDQINKREECDDEDSFNESAPKF